jgi:hypothetical protein
MEYKVVKVEEKFASGGMMANGGEVKDLNYNDIFDVLKDKIDETVTSEISSPFENVNNYEGEEVESNSRDGFIAFTDGGYEARWFEYLSSFYSSGSSLPTKALDDEKERQINYNLTSAKESFIEEYPEIVEELGEENIDYNSLYEAGYENEAEQLSESETADMDTIMCEIGAYYYTPENSRGIDDKHTIRLYGLINLESPYHRHGNLEDRFDVDITFNSISELEKKVDKGLKDIIDWYGGSMFNESTKELKIVRMADGGVIGNGKNGYVAFYKGKKIGVHADTMYEAQKIGAKYFNAKKEYEVNVVLAEIDGKQYIQSTSFADGGSVEGFSVGDRVIYKNGKYPFTIIELVDDENLPYANIKDYNGKIKKAYLNDLTKVKLMVAEEYVNTDLMNRLREGKMADGGMMTDERDKDGMLYALQEHVSSGEIASKTNASKYVDIDQIRSKAIQYYVENGDKPYSYAELESVLNKFDHTQMAHGGMLTKSDLESIKNKYEKNEDENYHGENVVLLAENFGNAEDLSEAKRIFNLHKKEGHLSSQNGKMRQDLHMKLIGKARAEMNKEGIQFAKGGKISRNKNKNDFKGMFDFFLENNDQPIGKRDLINMAYESSNGIDSAIPQSMVGDVDNTAFFVYDYQTDKMGELVDLRMKLKYSNVKVDVTIVQNGELKYGKDLPYELENATFHQALNYVFKHDDIEQFSIRPRKKYAKGGMMADGGMMARGGYVTDLDEVVASSDLKEELKSKMKEGDEIVAFGYTDYGGSFGDKVAIEYFKENHPKNIVFENSAYNGQNGIVFGEVAKDFLEETKDYPLGYEDMESFYYDMQNAQEEKDFKLFLSDIKNQYTIKKDALNWLLENKSGYYSIEPNMVDFSYSELENELEEEGLIKKKKMADGGIMADGGAIKGSNPSTGERFGVVIGSLEKEDGITFLTIRSMYSSRISSYELRFDEKGFLWNIADFGYTTDGTFPDMKKGNRSVRMVNADNKKESIDAIAKITSPSFAKKVYDYVQEEKMAKGGKSDNVDYSKQTTDDFTLGEIVYDVDNKRYGTIIGIYDKYNSDKFELRLDSDGMQPTENLRKVGDKGDKGTKKQLDEAITTYARLVKEYPNEGYPKQIKPDDSKDDDKPKNKWEYTDKDEIEYVVVKDKNGKELKFDGKYVISGVHDLLEKGGKLTEIGKYFSKNDVVSVFVNGKNILDKNTVSGVWIDKNAKPMAEDVADTKIGKTTIRKGANGWVAKTFVDNFKGFDWEITTIKNYKGDLTTTAQGGKSEDRGGYQSFSFAIFGDPSIRLKTSRPPRVTDKIVSEQHTEAMKDWKERQDEISEMVDQIQAKKKSNDGAKITLNKLADGGAIGFDALAKKVAKNYEGDKVKKEFQDEYGKTYDKKEAEEVGKKVAGKVYRQQQAKGKMAKGGKVAKKTGTNLNRSQSKMTLISRKASEIRKANEPWRDAFNRAKAMLYS